MADRYHHGDLRRAILDAAIDVVDKAGPTAVSLRSLAKLTGVSHAAPAHHFANKEGVFTALAAEGFVMLADALAAAGEDASMADLAVVYVRFALAHRAHFEIMFRPDLFDGDDPAVTGPQTRAYASLMETARGADVYASVPQDAVDLAAWGLVHGLATLFNTGAVEVADDVDGIVRGASAVLFRPSSAIE